MAKSCCERCRNIFLAIAVVVIVCLLSAGLLYTQRPDILSLGSISNPETDTPTYLRQWTRYPTPAPTSSPPGQKKKKPRRYSPGILNVHQEGIVLSQGLTARVIARVGQPVVYKDGSLSEALFHQSPDGGDSFVDQRAGNFGGWVYVSNSKVDENHTGGVGAITFSKDNEIIDYRMVLEGSTRNGGGGRTPWNSW